MKLKIKLALILIFLSYIANAQHQLQGSYWQAANLGLDFKCPVPAITFNPKFWAFSGSTSIADSAGNFLFFSNNDTIFNKYGDPVPGSEKIKKAAAQFPGMTLLLPTPGNSSKYYLFTNNTNGINDQYYHVVDAYKNDGAGEVITSNQLLHEQVFSPIRATYDKNNNRYWLLYTSFKDQRLHAKILDKNGISENSVKNEIGFPLSSIQYVGFNFSPSGNLLLAYYRQALELYRFDKMTGQIDLLVKWTMDEKYPARAAFSPDESKVYLILYTLDEMRDWKEKFISQLDLSIKDSTYIKQSEKRVFDLITYYGNDDLQLAIDGRIYFYLDFIFYRIEEPNNTFPDCKIVEILKAPEVKYTSYIIFPNMASSFNDFPPYRPKSKFQAIADTTLCSGEVISIGNQTLPNTTYNWSPAYEVDDHEKASPVFTKVNKSDIPRISNLYLTAKQNNCLFKDTVKVTVNPDMSTGLIQGSKSVCPYVEEVAYSLDNPLKHKISWQVNGGDIVRQENNGIAVDWYDTNPDAWVSMKTESPWGRCNTQQKYPVKINVELDTETPRGNQTVCYNLRNDNQYEITNTNGSVYTWSMRGGSVVSGQGTNQVQVSWHDNGNKNLWVQEYSQTIDTVCYGNSDTLNVLVFTDTAQVVIHAASVNMDSTITIDGELNGNITLPVALHKENDVETFSPRYLQDSLLTHLDQFVNPNDHAYYYQMNLKSTCELDIASAEHKTMLLRADRNEEQAAVNLQWNEYEGWLKGVKKYEIYRSVDDGSWEYFTETDQPEYIYTDGLAGINHHFRIKAIEKDGINYSWSNPNGTAFDHELFIPNVFTPNQDQFNEYFEIKRLEVYPENYLKVFNRWGKEVLFVPNYQNNWNAEGLSSGIYYYELFIERRNKNHKGYFQVVTQ